MKDILRCIIDYNLDKQLL